jgi:hypothetical protein
MKPNAKDGMEAHVRTWVQAAAGLGENAEVQVQEKPHCADESCPLRKTTLKWSDAAGKPHRAAIAKPLVYVRRPDVERALHLKTEGKS